ncbi:hypothetical protein LLEC1_01618 [Akanthomyces lecanii]|uniref:Bud22 domain-containing protein n=1 Tax=Cordyceps confragosa TaxID=2714763 RepID=A0A179IJF9_CORDF|nr:hypothetical protein LLEC1_01618 [Akanthomyces lecanii]
MVKRKRGAASLSIRHLEKFQEDIARALKEAKGFERQRMSKRQRAVDTTAEKKEKIEREINVLKSLDLHQTARAHLYSSLLRVKAIANHDDLPEQLKKGVAKPELTEDERVVLHNVTSGLYNRDGVKKAVDKAIIFVCEALDIPVPEKGTKGKHERKAKTQEIQEPVPAPARREKSNDEADADDTNFEGFNSDGDDDGRAALNAEDIDSDKEVEQENDFAAMDGLLGSSSDEDEDEERTRLWEKYRGKETVNLDDISVSGGDSNDDDADDDDDDDLDDQDEPSIKTKSAKKVTFRGVSLSPSPSPPPKRSKKAVVGRPTDSTFLPSLMGGYVSGSESASDVDVAPPKKRRGQRARRAIWEQKYGSNAKHVKDAARTRGRGRDDGWDMKRGSKVVFD